MPVVYQCSLFFKTHRRKEVVLLLLATVVHLFNVRLNTRLARAVMSFLSSDFLTVC